LSIGHNFTGTTHFNADININTLGADSSYIRSNSQLVSEAPSITFSTREGYEINSWADTFNFRDHASYGYSNVNIRGKLYIDASGGGKDYPAITVKNSVSDGQIKHYTKLNAGDLNAIIELYDNAIVTFNKPLVLAYFSDSQTGGIRITDTSVKLQAGSTQYNLNQDGHYFTGNVYVSGNLTASNIGTNIGTITTFPIKSDFITLSSNFAYWYVNDTSSLPIPIGTYIFEWIIYINVINASVYLAQVICKLDFSLQQVGFNNPRSFKPYNNIAAFSPMQINIIPNQSITQGYPFTMNATQVCELTSAVYPYLYFYTDMTPTTTLNFIKTNSMFKATRIK
jgi:hypothetical protein